MIENQSREFQLSIRHSVQKKYLEHVHRTGIIIVKYKNYGYPLSPFINRKFKKRLRWQCLVYKSRNND